MWTSSQSALLGKHTVYSYVHKKNKLRVILCPVEGASVTAYMRAVHAGSKDEAATVPQGAAHFIEHMSFRIQNGKIWSLASKGDVINAETNMDSTRFFVVHLPEQTEETIKIDSARFKEPKVPANKVSTEMKAVLNELERGQRAGNAMFRTTSSVAILEHPYHHSTIGTRTAVSNTKATDMEHFRRKFYVPNNTTLIFTGKIEPKKLMQMVDKHFGDIEMGTDCHPVHSPEPVQTGRRSVELKMPAMCPMVCMAFKAPRGSSKDSLVLQVIARLVNYNSEGRGQRYVTDGTFHDMDTYSPRHFDPYLWFFHATHEKTSENIRSQNEKKMLSVLQSFQTHKVPQMKLNKIKSSIMDDWNRSTESVQDLMTIIGHSVSMGHWKDFESKQVTLESITPQDIQATAHKVFRPTNMTITHVIPVAKHMELQKAEPMLEQLHKISPVIDDLPEFDSKEHWSVSKISPTMHFIQSSRASYLRATVSARFSPAEHDTASLLVASMDYPSKNNNANKLSKFHAVRNFTHDHEFIHMQMELPIDTHSITNGARIMFSKDWLKPRFETQTIEMHKKHIIAELKSRPRNQNWNVKRHFINALFEQTQYNIPIHERIRRISDLSMSDLETFHNTFLVNNDSTYVTIIAPDHASANTLQMQLPVHESIPHQTLSWTSKERKASSLKQHLDGYGSTAIMMGQTIPKTISYKEKMALRCAATILGGGMTGRLMHTVREQKGLGTYGIYSVLQTISKKTDPIICVQGTFSPASLEEGLHVTRELIRDWHAHGVTPLELSNAKDKMIGSLLIESDEVDRLGEIVHKYIMEEKEPNQAFHIFKDTVKNLDLQYVNETLAKYVDPSTFAEVIVGPV